MKARQFKIYVLCAVLLGSMLLPFFTPTTANAERPRVKVSKETTVIEGPVLKDGTVDYVAAVDRIAAKNADADNNAVVLLLQAFGPEMIPEENRKDFMNRLQIDLPKQKGQWFIEFGTFLEQQGLNGQKVNAIRDATADRTWKPWTAKQHPHLAKWLQRNEHAITNIVAASARPVYYMPLLAPEGDDRSVISILMPYLSMNRNIARAILNRAMLRFADGRFDESVTDVMSVYRFARLTGQEPILISQLVSIAIESMASETVSHMAASRRLSTKHAERMLREFDALGERFGTRDTVNTTERFMALDATQLVWRHGNDAAPMIGLPNNPMGKFMDQFFDPNIAMTNLNQWYDRMDTISELPWAQQTKAWSTFEGDLQSLKTKWKGIQRDPNAFRKKIEKMKPHEFRTMCSELMGDILAGILVPALHRAYERELISTTQTDLARVALAVSIYHNKHGRLPKSLDPLVPAVIRAIPIDPFDGKPVRYTIRGGSFVVYSVGANLKDDGGNVKKQEQHLDVVQPKPVDDANAGF